MAELGPPPTANEYLACVSASGVAGATGATGVAACGGATLLLGTALRGIAEFCGVAVYLKGAVGACVAQPATIRDAANTEKTVR